MTPPPLGAATPASVEASDEVLRGALRRELEVIACSSLRRARRSG